MISCLIKTKQWSMLSDLIEIYPDFAKIHIDIVENGKYIQRLPIHEICRHRPPLNLLEVLVMAHPSSLSLKDVNNGSLALHFACRCGASEEVIRFLIKKYPNSVYAEDKYGCVPSTTARRSSYGHKESIIGIFDEL